MLTDRLSALIEACLMSVIHTVRISVFVEVMAKTALIDRYGPYLGVKQGRFVLKVQGEIKWEKLQ
jgi:hypothetical protein